MGIPFSRQSGHIRVTLRSSRHSSSALGRLGASYTSPGLRTLPSGAYDMVEVAMGASFTVTVTVYSLISGSVERSGRPTPGSLCARLGHRERVRGGGETQCETKSLVKEVRGR